MMTSRRIQEDQRMTSVRQMLGINRFGNEGEAHSLAEPFPAIAVPVHHGLDGLIRPVSFADKPCLVKTYHHDVLAPYCFENAVTSYAKAGELGLGAKLIVSDCASESLLIEYKRDGWKTAVVTDFKDSALYEKLVCTKKTWHMNGSSSLQLSAFDVFDCYYKMWDQITPQLPMPVNIDITIEKLAEWVRTIKSAFIASGFDLAVLHGENTISNVLISESNQLVLVDFDRTTIADPMWDLAAMSLEICTDDEDRNQLLEMYYGQTSVSLLARLKLYTVIDDAVWALWALLGELNTYRKGPELYKYAANRLVRLCHHVSTFELSKLIKEM
jgi:hypothetical protein